MTQTFNEPVLFNGFTTFTDNVLIDSQYERAIIFKRSGEFSGAINPIFHVGRMTQGGDGSMNFRVLYQDDNTQERTVFEFDSKGIVASVKQYEGSHFEGAISGETHPRFRLNSWGKMSLQMGDGENDTDMGFFRHSAGIAGIDADALFIRAATLVPETDEQGGYIFWQNGVLKVKDPSGNVSIVSTQ